MIHHFNSPYNFADGQILSYHAEGDSLLVQFRFWNSKIGLLSFVGFAGSTDYDALNSEISSAGIISNSEFIESIIARQYEQRPLNTELNHYCFYALDGYPVLNIIAKGCTFREI